MVTSGHHAHDLARGFRIVSPPGVVVEGDAVVQHRRHLLQLDLQDLRRRALAVRTGPTQLLEEFQAAKVLGQRGLRACGCQIPTK